MEFGGTPNAPATAAEAQSEASWTQQVNSAFRNFHSILALSRSPLAAAALVAPALVRDALSPTADERGHALRLVLQWAIGLLAPEPPAYPLGVERPYDDPTWRDPRWWRYNILRHRYLEPLHPDEFVEGGRYTETLIALTGIPSSDTFFEERNRAIREVAAWLQQRAADATPNEALQQMAIEDALRPLRQNPAARTLLDIAATFDGVFPRSLLLQIAEAERVAGVEQALLSLTSRRLLRTDDQGAELWLSPVLRAYLAGRQPEEQLQRRHVYAARHYEAAGEPLDAARHWQRAGRGENAWRILSAAAGDLVHELRIGELRDVLTAFQANDLEPEHWRDVQILICDLAVRLGQREEALAACRRGLKQARTPAQQARIFRRIGKLYEQFNQPHALGYYHQAAEAFDAEDPEFVALLKDRAWLYVLRREWPDAEADLMRALKLAPEGVHEVQADLFDVLAILYRDQRRLDEAIAWARKALALRERLGHLPRIADSYNNLGLLYNALGDYTGAIAAFDEALAVYRQIGNQERIGGAMLNIGVAHHLAGRRHKAIAAYHESLPLLEAAGRRLVQVRAHHNLAEAYAELAEIEAARHHWQIGYDMSLAAGFDDEARDLDAMREQFPALQAATADPPLDARAEPAAFASGDAAHPALPIARAEGCVTAKALMDATGISKATATRQLADLVRRGLLQAQGKGRATIYTLASNGDGAPAASGGASDYPSLPGDLPAPVARALHQQLPALTTAYGMTVLHVDTIEPVHPLVRMTVRFACPPDLSTFFELERRLQAQLGFAVDLRPVA